MERFAGALWLALAGVAWADPKAAPAPYWSGPVTISVGQPQPKTWHLLQRRTDGAVAGDPSLSMTKAECDLAKDRIEGGPYRRAVEVWWESQAEKSYEMCVAALHSGDDPAICGIMPAQPEPEKCSSPQSECVAHAECFQ